MKRDRWLDHITSSEHVHRFLARIGSSTTTAIAAPIDESAIKSYLARLAGGHLDARVLLEVFELFTNGYVDFCSRTLPQLLHVLTNRTHTNQEIVGPGIRGVVRWDLTKLGRISRTVPMGRYVANVPFRSFSTPENMLLVWLLRDIIRAIDLIAEKVGTPRLHPILNAMRTACVSALRTEELSGVDRIGQLAPHMVSTALQSRHEGYRAAAQLARRRKRLRDRNARWELVLQLLRKNWLEPIDDNDLFELYALSRTLEVISDDLGLGEPTTYGLLGSALEPAAIFGGQDLELRVFFNRTPGSIFGGISRYRGVMAAYAGIAASDRRPDIVLALSGAGDSTRTFFVEVKNATSHAYLRDSIYKVFGYLYDYEHLFPSSQAQKAALYIPKDLAVSLQADEESQSGIVLTSEDERPRLASAIRAALNLPE